MRRVTGIWIAAAALACLAPAPAATSPRPARAPAAPAAPAAPVAVTHGLAIPAAHPRLWFDADRLARAEKWNKKHPFTPRSEDWIGRAARALVTRDAAECRTVAQWALGASRAIRTEGVSCDACRWHGEAIILAYDWCHAYLSPAERSELVAVTNRWIEHWRVQAWGGVPMHHNNYYWGYLRNELEWAIATYDENRSVAEGLLDDVFDRRLAGDFNPATTKGSRGGVGIEGSQYGPYVAYYATVPFSTAALLGRDVFAETSFWREAVYAYVYGTTPGATLQPWTGASGPVLFPFSDDEQWVHTTLQTANGGNVKGDFMAAAAIHFGASAVGKHARRWLEATGAPVDFHVRAADPGGASLPFTALPLDYFAAGPGYLWGRSSWSPDATAYMLQLGEGAGSGHAHVDWGSWQLWRKGRFLSRETVAYGESIAGPGGAGVVSASLAPAHNTLLVDGTGIRDNPWSTGAAVVRRLESRAAYAFAAVDLTRTGNNPRFVHHEREFVFVRPLETLVVLDRIESRSPGAVKTFVAHCEAAPAIDAGGAVCTAGSQSLVVRTLVPAAPAYRVVEEGKRFVGQHRLEIETRPGTARSHVLTVLQGKDANAPALTPRVTEDDQSFTVELDARTRITFAKGITSAGGAITVAGQAAPLAQGVQPMDVTDAGPVWR